MSDYEDRLASIVDPVHRAMLDHIVDKTTAESITKAEFNTPTMIGPGSLGFTDEDKRRMLVFARQSAVAAVWAVPDIKHDEGVGYVPAHMWASPIQANGPIAQTLGGSHTEVEAARPVGRPRQIVYPEGCDTKAQRAAHRAKIYRQRGQATFKVNGSVVAYADLCGMLRDMEAGTSITVNKE